MQVLHTVEEIHKLFPTSGSNPMLVTCNDLQDWVCKYDRASKNLLNELIASKYAAIWNIKTPKTALIRVKKKHVPLDKYPNVPHHLLDKYCFGSLFLEGSKEIDLSVIPLFKDKLFRNKISNDTDFLKISLFDIWLANEDRNHNNFNLLMHVSPNNLSFLALYDFVWVDLKSMVLIEAKRLLIWF
jgi:hypothetical protein